MEPRLSIVAKFDDLVRNTAVLTAGIEPDFLSFVQNQEKCRQQWMESSSSDKGLKRKLESSEMQVSTLTTQLKHARTQIDHERTNRLRAEQDRETLERQIALVRDLLTEKNNHSVLNDKDREKLAFLNSYQPSHALSPRRSNMPLIEESVSMLSDVDISYDKTEEDLDVSYLRSGNAYKKRPSAPPMEDESPGISPAKPPRRSKGHRRHRRSRSAVVTTTVTVDDRKVNAKAEITGPKKSLKHRRIASASNLDDTKENAYDEGYRSPKYSGYQTPLSDNSPPMRRYNSAGKGLNRPHAFVNKTVIKPETCNPCGKRIKFGKVALKCKDCRATAHPECKESVPLPCVPSTNTPGTTKINNKCLADFAPLDPPLIPAIIIHCINEVESRGLSEVGIYRVPGSEREVRELKEKFLRGKGTPNLVNINDIHVVCGCLRSFLRDLKESVIPKNLWKNFVNASMIQDYDEAVSLLYQAVSEMPQVNRDTLAFIILHLQRVSETPECRMPASNLAKVFGPTVVGYSCAEPEPMQIMSETPKQAKVMEHLMSISSDYWVKFISIDAEDMIPIESQTPQTPGQRTVMQSMLGPVGTPTENIDSSHTAEKKAWYTPRFGSKSNHFSKKPSYFSHSPDLH